MYMVARGPRRKGAKPGKESRCSRFSRSAGVYRGLISKPSGLSQVRDSNGIGFPALSLPKSFLASFSKSVRLFLGKLCMLIDTTDKLR